MVRPKELIESVIRSLQRDERLDDSIQYVGYEPSINTEPIKLPLIEVSPVTQIRLSETNSDKVGYEYDDGGNQVGTVYQTLYDLDLTVAVYTAQDSKWSPRKLGQEVRDILYRHDIKGPNRPLRYEDGSPIEEVWRFRFMEGTHNDDLSTTPPLRRWSQTVMVSASEQYTVREDYVEGVGVGLSDGDEPDDESIEEFDLNTH